MRVLRTRIHLPVCFELRSVLLRGRIAPVIPLCGSSRQVVLRRGRRCALHRLKTRRAMQRESQRLLRRRRTSLRLLRTVHRYFRVLRCARLRLLKKEKGNCIQYIYVYMCIETIYFFIYSPSVRISFLSE